MKHLLRLLLIAPALLTLVACHAPAGKAAAPMELKIYDVPAAQAANIVGALGNALGGSASITMPAPGKLLAYAPHDTQASIGQAIEALGAQGITAPAASQIDLHFWIVDAEPGNGVDDASLHPLSTTFDALRKAMGPLHFRLNQSLAALGSVGHDGQIQAATDGGYIRNIDFTIKSLSGNDINLRVAYDDAGQTGLAKFKTEITAAAGQYLVLAQAPGGCAPALPGKVAPACEQKPVLRLFIVRADRLPAHT